MSAHATIRLAAAQRRRRCFMLLVMAALLAADLAVAQVADAPLGATVQGQGAARSVVFRVWAPNATKVGVAGDFNGWHADFLQPEPNRPGHWVLESRRARPGDAYRYEMEGLLRRDPRARAVDVDDNKGVIVDSRTYAWGPAANWTMPPKEDLVMYEMHLSTFAAGIPGQGSPFELARKRIPYLKALGINCIQLMPVNEFPGSRSWGYNPSDLFAVESSYGGSTGFRDFIKACHTNGIAVLLDIVHNHYGPDKIAVWQFDQRLSESDGGIYFYRDEERALTEWGPRPDFSREEVRTFILDSVKMFLDEYRVDGFRWDSVHNIRYTQNGQRSNADGDRLLSEANAWMRKNRPAALRIAEDHAFDGGGVGFDAQWNSGFQAELSEFIRSADTLRELSGFATELERLDGFTWVNFAECHDSAGDLNRHHRLPVYIDPSDPNSLRARALSLLANGIVMTVPGFPMMLQGFEMHDTADFSDNIPVPWTRALKTHAGIVQATRDLIHLRRNLKGHTPGLQGEELRVIHLDDDAKVLAYSRRIRNTPRDHATVVVITFSPNPLKQHGVRFPSTGAWFCHFNSGLAAYAKDFDNLGPRPGTGYNLPAGQTTLPLDMSRLSMLVFSKSRPPGATLTKAPYAPEIESPAEREPSEPRPVTDFVEEVLDPFPYVFVPLPAEWHP